MFLIDKPYISDFLIRTIKENNFPIVASSEAKELISDRTLNWIPEEEAIETCKNQSQPAIYSNSENTIQWVNKNLSFSDLPKKIMFFKNKIKFRELIKDIYPNYFYQGIKLSELEDLDIKSIEFPFIIKPSVGFFSMGVYKVENLEEWKIISRKIKNEVEITKFIYPKEVINLNKFIIEEFIHGEEYAIDCYFNKTGEPVILNILHHIFSSGKDVSDRVYSTSKKIIENYHIILEDFLKIIGNKLDLKNFPIHMEVRIDKEGKIIPIEINPLRFGGWCTTGDLSWYAYGINSYEYFFKGIKPDWNKILESKSGKIFSIIVLDNNSGVKENNIVSFDYDKLLEKFSKPMVLRKVNYLKYPVFGFVFVENSIDNKHELTHILNSNLQEFIKV
ncbi:MAG: ATP-grasp domain-containing protein [Bacteroidetes bacterium]|nr:MAG: ATP-grasp domain-containing protein [Bacteroidota bacterium]